MEFPMQLSHAIQLYDYLVDEISKSSSDSVAELTTINSNNLSEFRTICCIILQVHEQDPNIMSDKQIDAISTSLKQVESILDRMDANFSTVIPEIRWDRPTLTVHLKLDEDYDDDNEENIIDCWGDRDGLEQEEAMLLAMASTPIPSETDAPSYRGATARKRTSDDLNAVL